MINITDKQLEDFLLFSNQWDFVRADGARRPHVDDFILQNVSTAEHNVRVLHNLIWWNTQVWSPLMVVIGLIGNITCAAVLLSSPCFRKVSPSHYVAARMCTDAGYLLTLMFVWLSHFQHIHHHLYFVVGWCQFVSYGSHLTQFLATWVMAVLMIDRIIFVLRPERRKSTCSVMRARAIIIGLLIIAMVVYLNISLTEGVLITKERYMCSPLPRFLHVTRILANFDAILNVLLPYTIIVLVLIVLRSHLRGQDSWRADDCPIIIDMQMTHTALVIGVWYVVLTLPSHLLRLYTLVHGVVQPDGAVDVTVLICQQLFRVPAYLSCAIVPLVLLTVDRNFRGQLPCCRAKCRAKDSPDGVLTEEVPMTSV